jgi:dienelactone hydrolase
MRTLSLLALLVCSSISVAKSPWDVKAIQAAEVKPEWGQPAGKAKEVYYPGEPLQGKPTKIFAYYARPATGDGPFPAMVLIHGGGGKAFQNWAEHWAARGYCAIAMDLSGNGPKGRLPDGGPDQSDEVKFKDFDETTAKDMWTYHAVAAAIRGHNLLRGLPEVDKDRIGVTGISWGGYLTCIVAGLDDRFKVAVPVYGCGFLHENSVWMPARFEKVDHARGARWAATFDPSVYLPGVKCPILFLNGTNDFAYPMDSYQKCYALVPGAKNLSVRVRLPHGHIWTFGEVDAFVDSHLKGGVPLPVLSDLAVKGETATAKVETKTKLKQAQLHYAVAQGPWQKREWKSIPAQIGEGIVSAKLPPERPLVFELAVTDERGLEVTSTYQILDVAKTPDAAKLTREEIAEGWVMLFDCESPFGWKATGEVAVKDGTLVIAPGEASSLSYVVPWDRFELTVISGAQRGTVTKYRVDPGQVQNSSESNGDTKNPVASSMNGTVLSIRAGKAEPGIVHAVLCRPTGTTPIFNGKDLTGWKTNKDKAASKFTVTKEGWLNVKDGPGDLQTEATYADFVLQFDGISNGKHLNSGIFFRCLPGLYQQGYEAQIRNQWEGDDRTKPVDSGTGAIYRRVPARKVVSTDGEWFTMTVAAKGKHLSTWVDGYPVVQWVDDRKEAANARQGARTAAGAISIQGHDPTTDLSFRNLRILDGRQK